MVSSVFSSRESCFSLRGSLTGTVRLIETLTFVDIRNTLSETTNAGYTLPCGQMMRGPVPDNGSGKNTEAAGEDDFFRNLP